MSGKNVNSEIQKKYENEVSEFFIQKINQAGGSLQFQHLSGLLSQLRFEVRNAIGATKSELMKFLRAHPNIFQVDKKGIVTVIDSISLDDDSINEDNSTNDKKTLPPKIENGQGVVIKISPEFAIIKVVKPINTFVHFTPAEYGANKDSLFIDLSLEVSAKVRFNAVYGHNDYEIKYRATKVWLQYNSDDENSDSQSKSNNSSLNIRTGEGIIKELFPNIGFISAIGNQNETVLFYRNCVTGCDTNVTDFFSIGDRVEFVAKNVKSGSKTQWQATEVRKKTEKSSRTSASSGVNYKTHDKCSAPRKLENELGKIFPYHDGAGAVIKFGKNFSELVDGDSGKYFLYGSEVSDILWEFSEGDDVKFDAVKCKTPPGWKAVLVWVGEKPTCAISYKSSIDENADEISDDHNAISPSNALTENSNLSVRSRTMKHTAYNAESKVKSNTIDKKFNRSPEYKMNHSKAHKTNSMSKSKNENSSRKNNSVSKSKNENSSRKNNSVSKSKNENSSRENLPMSKYKVSREKVLPESVKNSGFFDENYNSLLLSKTVSDLNLSQSSDSSSEEEDELQSVKYNSRKFLKGNESEHPANAYKDNSTDFQKSISSNENCKVSPKNASKLKAGIKKFEEISGKITNVYCKAAIIQSSYLQKEVDFILDAFYLNGKSVEEQQVIDLKEVIKIGDDVNFNCFEIIDDFGEIYQKVTIAWKGNIKPNVYEISPEEFIAEQEISVSINELDSRCSEAEMLDKDFLVQSSSAHSDSDTESHSENKSPVTMFDDTLSQISIESKNEVFQEFEENIQSDNHHALLSERIIQRLRSYGYISSNSEVDLNFASDIINTVLKDSDVENFSSSTVSMEAISENLCSSCAEKSRQFSSEGIITKHAETQTIITGEIVALRDGFSIMKWNRANCDKH